ncbi:MAG: cytidylate kinase-like family protein [Clostridia bacterium]|nr:cytidylate kinase-like family protein [Clostridia bacterium]
MKNRIITINREYSSGGGNIAKKTAEILGIPCHDSDIIDILAAGGEFAEKFIVENGEYAVYKSKLFELLTSKDNGGQSAQDRLYAAQAELIRKLAAEGPCVIVGRCAEYILRDSVKLMRVFVHAEMPARIAMLKEEFGNSIENPEQYLRDRDARRKAYYFAHTDIEWSALANYDLVVDSKFGIDACAKTIAHLYKTL